MKMIREDDENAQWEHSVWAELTAPSPDHRAVTKHSNKRIAILHFDLWNNTEWNCCTSDACKASKLIFFFIHLHERLESFRIKGKHVLIYYGCLSTLTKRQVFRVWIWKSENMTFVSCSPWSFIATLVLQT